MSVNWTRRNVIVTVIVGIVTVVVSVAIYFLESENREIPTETVESPEASEVSPRVLISSVHVSAVAMDVPAAFELEIQAGGISSIPARNVNVVLDFGRAEIEVCGYAPKYLVTNVVGQDKSHRRFEIAKLAQKEKLHIRCIISSPIFDQIIINGDNIINSHSMDFRHYKDFIIDTKISFWIIWRYAVVSALTIILIIFFWIRLFEWL